MTKFLIVAGLMFAGGGLAYADEIEIHRDRPTEMVAPPRRPVEMEHRSVQDCQTTTVTKENDRGDSKTVQKTDCD